MTKELICIACPRGCVLTVTINDATNIIEVSGNSCPKGAIYGKQEVLCPMRTLTTTVACKPARHNGETTGFGEPEFIRLPVKTGCEIPLEEMTSMIEKIRSITAAAPVRYGDCLAQLTAENGTKIPILACASTEAK
ncbi:DUF1667 domain-containing protein [Treponema medium]|uniref:4Fe-4S Mo/W bis-MGD-type domain-containing protein n=2 Tax=Treponema medium TaxID=58231 RepID=A0AA87NKF7_TREMD|nr:DUF1667 domain-containing protein [Treponema medium]EPF27859.1 hypothetical protein HMPREF9195_01989 [Treponema medium ATCC 700293]QSH98090.1 DUF1667 domain-containing protein [Treponema medium]